ncbi:hypothetical protein [Nocardia brasiliensis]|uniref:hypothetical protein n=1 Tax=Nocardia brasiliensis TaxID=37326 RepID=UPI001894D40F|nr:hypothetical protein [Nocardia brasiliensis]MBF6126676.1 hypothetical protein [Nocardia brasiliensis]MBF6546933.1 hypothetical protein [Nocardia brasiliensis]
MTAQPVERGDGPVELRWAPVRGCTLPTAAQPAREAEFAALFTAAVRTVQRPSPNVLRLAVAAAAEQTARDLAARESGCCSFFTFAFTPRDPDTVWMDIEVPTARVAVLDGLAAQAIEASGS